MHPTPHTRPIASITIGPRIRKDLGDLKALADSISAEGLLQAIGITQDGLLVFGERRLRACRDFLSRTEIDVRVVDVSSIAAGEQAENEVRKDFTPSERIAIAAAVDAAVEERRGRPPTVQAVVASAEIVDRGPPFPKPLRTPPSSTPAERAELPAPGVKTRDFVAKAVGFKSGKQLERAAAVVERGVPAVVEKMDRGQLSITAASNVVKLPAAKQADLVKRIDEGTITAKQVRQVVREIGKELYPTPDRPTPEQAREQARRTKEETGEDVMVLASDKNYYGYIDADDEADQAACAAVYSALRAFWEAEPGTASRLAGWIRRERAYQASNVTRALAFVEHFKEAWRDGQAQSAA